MLGFIALTATLFDRSAQAALERITADRTKRPYVHVLIDGQWSKAPFKIDCRVDYAAFCAHCRVRGNGVDLESTQVDGLSIQLLHSSENYDRLRGPSRMWFFGQSRMSELGAQLIPAVLFLDVAKLATGAKMTSIPGGNRFDYTLQTQRGPLMCRIEQADDGRMTAYQEGGTYEAPDRRWNFKYDPTATRPSPSDWSLSIPDGYAPFALIELPQPLEPGSKFPMTGWKDARTGAVVDLAARFKDKPSIFAVFGDDANSREAMKALHQLAADGTPTAVTAAPSASTGPGWVVDGTGKLIDQLSPQATPTLYIIDAKGALSSILVGFDRAHPEAYVKEARRQLREAQ